MSVDLEHPPAVLIGGRFAIERLAGGGGAGRVYRARDREGGGLAAVKVVVIDGEVAAERFAREAAALGRLAHPAVVRFLAHGALGEGEAWLSTEWLEGEDLRARLGRGPLGVEEALALGARVAGGLAEAHRRGVVHRDLKPSNLLLVGGEPGAAVLLDFGVCRVSGHDAPITRVGALVGTAGFMAPEQAAGERVDGRADLFSLGAVLFRGLAGRPPFPGDNPFAVIARMMRDDAPRLATLRPEVPPALDALVARLLAREPGERPADADAVARELGAISPRPRGT